MDLDGRIGEVLALMPGAYVSEGQKLATVIPGGELLIIAEFNPEARERATENLVYLDVLET